MSLHLQPVRVATGSDEDGMLVFDTEHRLLAVFTHLSDAHQDLSGFWFLEAGFGAVETQHHPTFADLQAAQAWIADRLARGRELAWAVDNR